MLKRSHRHTIVDPSGKQWRGTVYYTSTGQCLGCDIDIDYAAIRRNPTLQPWSRGDRE